MKMLFKILSVFVIGFTSYFTFCTGAVPLTEGYHPLYPLIDTYCSKDYSIKKFDQIKIGDTKERVIALVGQPLYQPLDTISAIKTLYFTGDGRLLQYAKDNLDYEDFAWYRSSVTIDKNNKVIEIDKGWSHD